MLRKYTAIFFLTAAYALLLGHNIIPHHHHDNDHDLTEHHQTHHSHDGDEKSNDLSHLFSHIIHSADGFVVTTNHSITNAFTQQLLSIVALLPVNFSLKTFDIPPLFDRPPSHHLSTSFFYTCTFGLRAPPAFIA